MRYPHKPVLAREAADLLVYDPDGTYVDGTAESEHLTVSPASPRAVHIGAVGAVDQQIGRLPGEPTPV
ncbi:MAG: hypothetical protein DRH20_16525, partial [Deltaproteobacteria bacterium]